MRIVILDRIHQRHPELTERNVITAFRSVMVDIQRRGNVWMAVGLDDRGRNVEMLYKVIGDNIVIYHAFTPPTKKFMREITERERQQWH